MHVGLPENVRPKVYNQLSYSKCFCDFCFFLGVDMGSWKKALAIALGLPSTILGVFLFFQELVRNKVVTQGAAQIVLISIVIVMLIKMIQVSWKKKK
jgi:hypothetical protein